MKRQSTFVLAQLSSEGEPAVNFEKAKKAVAEANEKYKPDLMIFPECFMSYFSDHPPPRSIPRHCPAPGRSLCHRHA